MSFCQVKTDPGKQAVQSQDNMARGVIVQRWVGVGLVRAVL